MASTFDNLTSRRWEYFASNYSINYYDKLLVHSKHLDSTKCIINRTIFPHKVATIIKIICLLQIIPWPFKTNCLFIQSTSIVPNAVQFCSLTKLQQTSRSFLGFCQWQTNKNKTTDWQTNRITADWQTLYMNLICHPLSIILVQKIRAKKNYATNRSWSSYHFYHHVN